MYVPSRAAIVGVGKFGAIVAQVDDGGVGVRVGLLDQAVELVVTPNGTWTQKFRTRRPTIQI